MEQNRIEEGLVTDLNSEVELVLRFSGMVECFGVVGILLVV